MFLQGLTINRTLLPLCAAVIGFRYRHRLLKLYQALITWKGWKSRLDPPGGEKLLCCYVMNNSMHGQPESVLQTFEQWIKEPEHGKKYTQVSRNLLGPEKGVFLDEVIARVAPTVVLDLGTYCGYSAIRMLRLLPPGGKLYTVEQCREVADMAEEMILVAGFKNMQFQLLILSSEEAISTMKSSCRVDTFDLVLMDHNPGQYLNDLRALEEYELLAAGSTILANDAEGPGAAEFLQEVQNDRRYRVQSKCENLLEIVCIREPIISHA